MLKAFFTLSGLFLCIALFAQQTSTDGLVTMHNSKYETGKTQYVPNAQVEEKFDRSQPTTTDGNGGFKLILVGIPLQESFNYSVRKEGLEVVNFDALNAIAGQKDTAKIYMAKPQYIADFRKSIYNVGKTSAEKSLERNIKKLEDERAALQQNATANAVRINTLSAEIEKYAEELKQTDKYARELAEKYERINLDDATPLYQEAFRHFQAGELKLALQVLQTTETNARNILTERGRIAAIRKEADERDSIQQVRTAETMQALRLKVDMHRSLYELDSAMVAYELLIQLDSNNIENIYDYGDFLESINRYDKALRWLQKVTDAKTDAWRIANAWGKMGQVYEETGDFTNAPRAYARLEVLYDSLYRRQPENDFYKSNLAISYEKLGDIYQAQGKFDTALVFFQKQTKLFEELYRDNPKSEEMKNGLAISYQYLGIVYQAQGNFDTALVFFQKYNQFNEELYRDNPKSEGLKNGLAISYQYLGIVYQAQGNFDTALVFFQKRSQLGEELYRDNPKSEGMKNGLAISYEKLGAIYQAQGNFDTALVFFQKRSQLGEELYRDNPKSEEMKNGLAISYRYLGDIYQAQGKFDTALVFFQKYNQFNEELYRDNPKSEEMKNGLAISYRYLGDIYQAQGKFDTALVFFQKRSQLGEELYRDNPKSESLKNGLAISYRYLGDIYQAQGKFDTALVFFQKRSQLGEELYRDNPKSESLKNGLAISYSKLGEIYQVQGKFDTALVFFQKYNQFNEELYRNNPKNVELWFGLGVSYYKLGALSVELDSTEQAIGYYERAEQVFRELYAAIGLEDYKRKYEYLEAEIKKLKEPANPLLQKIQTLEQQVAKATAPADKVKYQKELVQLFQGSLDANPDNSDIKAYTANAYGRLAWLYLFAKDFSAAETSTQKAFSLENDATFYVPLLLSQLYLSKWETISKDFTFWKDIPYDDKRIFKEVFLSDLKELEKAGITHPDVAKVRKLLRE